MYKEQFNLNYLVFRFSGSVLLSKLAIKSILN